MNNLGKKIKEMSHLITKLKREKSKNFQEAIKKTENNGNYKFGELLIERHFLFKALQEVK